MSTSPSKNRTGQICVRVTPQHEAFFKSILTPDTPHPVFKTYADLFGYLVDVGISELRKDPHFKNQLRFHQAARRYENAQRRAEAEAISQEMAEQEEHMQNMIAGMEEDIRRTQKGVWYEPAQLDTTRNQIASWPDGEYQERAYEVYGKLERVVKKQRRSALKGLKE